jgi:hypothetical protein
MRLQPLKRFWLKANVLEDLVNEFVMSWSYNKINHGIVPMSGRNRETWSSIFRSKWFIQQEDINHCNWGWQVLVLGYELRRECREGRFKMVLLPKVSQPWHSMKWISQWIFTMYLLTNHKQKQLLDSSRKFIWITQSKFQFTFFGKPWT